MDIEDLEAPTINRYLIVLEGKETFLEWVKQCPETNPDLTIEMLNEDGSAYLIPDNELLPERWLEKNYEAIFELELDNWEYERELWPPKRSYKEFQRFFKVIVRAEVYDLG